MAYHDQFEDADVLDSLSWVAMSDGARIMKLASLFLKRESDISSEHRNWEGPTVSNLRPFVKSYYVPPRGQGKATIEMVLKAIAYQRKVQDKRSQNKRFMPYSAKKRNSEYAIKPRINKIAKRLYTLNYNDSEGERKTRKPNCQAMGLVNGIIMIVDEGGGWRKEHHYPRIYMRDKATGKAKVVVLDPEADEPTPDTIISALAYIAPEDSVRTMFNGQLMTLNFDEEAFECGGDLWEWRNVHRVYSSKGTKHPVKTRCKPKKQKD